MLKFFVLVSVYFAGSSSLIVPGEVPTLLSLIYSNIPTIKKGTDSRVGWGFRLGNRADFQVLVELGPQTNTQPLGNQDSSSSTSAKRHVGNGLSDTFWAQRQKERQTEPPHFSDTVGGHWLKEWSEQMKPTKEQNQVFVIEDSRRPPESNGASPVLGAGEIDAKLVIPDDSTAELKELRRKAGKKKVTTSATNTETTTSKEDTLDNVDLDK